MNRIKSERKFMTKGTNSYQPNKKKKRKQHISIFNKNPFAHGELYNLARRERKLVCYLLY